MAKVSISEAARLAGISRPTIYKLMNSGQLNFTSVVKAGKTVKNIDTSELIRVFGTIANLPAAKDFTVNSEQEITQVNTPDLQHLQHKIELLQKENEGLKEAVASREEHISSLRQAMLLLEHKQDTQQPSPPPAKWWRFWK
ncbi:helix-turn-helix domain-containing protein [Pseudomonas aeruginosa]|jgi:excisionase family DNA binding protein|uniref:helix-turn-helix domain-containing protein n=1 Tax=Klebsiella pneumoniae TaxID=573 RepID=UPI0012324242|nr:helix-turn-helix domain-containing protein [Klebsiella pneumoniae]KAA5586600.1 helix-turn-helix domain-containing protein [Pseudomonas aeruginosa]KAA5722469.1 helix-turn-helix domain-containing protein [Klebsiella pneumoniae]